MVPHQTPGGTAVSGMPDTTKNPLTSGVSGCLKMGATGLEPVTPSVSKYTDNALAPRDFAFNSRHFEYIIPAKTPLCKVVRKMRENARFGKGAGNLPGTSWEGPRLRPCPDEWLTAYPVGTRVNNPKNEEPACIEPLER
jgi:hypothetical protein